MSLLLPSVFCCIVVYRKPELQQLRVRIIKCNTMDLPIEIWCRILDFLDLFEIITMIQVLGSVYAVIKAAAIMKYENRKEIEHINPIKLYLRTSQISIVRIDTQIAGSHSRVFSEARSNQCAILHWWCKEDEAIKMEIAWRRGAAWDLKPFVLSRGCWNTLRTPKKKSPKCLFFPKHDRVIIDGNLLIYSTASYLNKENVYHFGYNSRVLGPTFVPDSLFYSVSTNHYNREITLFRLRTHPSSNCSIRKEKQRYIELVTSLNVKTNYCNSTNVQGSFHMSRNEQFYAYSIDAYYGTTSIGSGQLIYLSDGRLKCTNLREYIKFNNESDSILINQRKFLLESAFSELDNGDVILICVWSLWNTHSPKQILIVHLNLTRQSVRHIWHLNPIRTTQHCVNRTIWVVFVS